MLWLLLQQIRPVRLYVHHCLGKLLNGVETSISHDRDNRKFLSQKFGRCLQSFVARNRYDLLDPFRLPRLSLHDDTIRSSYVQPAFE